MRDVPCEDIFKLSDSAAASEFHEWVQVVPVFKNVGERSVKDHRPFSLLSVVAKVFEKLVNDRIVDEPEKCEHSFIFSMVLGLLDQLQIFLQLYLIESVGLLTGLGLLEL